MGDSEFEGAFGRAAAQVQGGPFAGCAPDFQFQPADAAADAGAKGLGASLLGGEARGKALGGLLLPWRQ